MYLLDSLLRIHIWQVSPQLSCGDTCQIWMWYSIANMYFANAEKRETNGTKVTPTPAFFHVSGL